VNHQLGLQINLQANFTGHPCENNPYLLPGTFEEIIPALNDPGGGTIIIRASRVLKRI